VHRGIEPALRRAFMLVEPEYFSWPVEAQERYRAGMPGEHAFRIRQVLLKAIFGIHVKTLEELEAAIEAFGDSESLVFNRALLPVMGVGDDCFFLNECLGAGETILDFETLHDYDYADYCFQEQARKEEIPDYAVKAYRGSLYHAWARLQIDGVFHYASLSMAASYIYSLIDECGSDRIDALIPHHYVNGKDHGKREEKGTIFSQRIVAGGMEPQLEELRHRFSAYLSARHDSRLSEYDAGAANTVYAFDQSRENDPHVDFVFSDKTALKYVRFRHFMTDCRTLLRDKARLEAVIGRERQSAIDFVEGAYQDIIGNFDPKVLKFRKKRKVIIADGALKGLL
jgi:hypothetical protein